jgi:hypothetical protein
MFGYVASHTISAQEPATRRNPAPLEVCDNGARLALAARGPPRTRHRIIRYDKGVTVSDNRVEREITELRGRWPG